MTQSCDFGLFFSDKYAGHPDAINAMIAVTDNVLITGI